MATNAEKLHNMEQSLEVVENWNCDGELIWKIENYKQKKEDAVSGRKLSIDSHPFYTSRYGYKMSLTAYLNGHGSGKGTHLSVMFVLMRGRFDELLDFPFQQEVTLSLLCSQAPEHSIRLSFLPDATSASFSKPQMDKNIAVEFPQFALHSEVESSSFLKDDCIYIRAEVQPGGDDMAL